MVPDRGRRSRAERGFTLAEVLAVLAVVSVLAAVATPGFVNMMRDRRTAQETGAFLDAFRVARARALGRGGAVRVVVTAGEVPSFTLEEHITDPDGDGDADDPNSQPVPGCTSAGIWRTIDSFGTRGTTRLDIFDHITGAAADGARVCFTPRGRTMADYPPEGIVNPSDVVTPIRLTTSRGAVEGTSDNKVRQIFIMPHGITRMSL